MRRNSSFGFTLVELLVVIAIIGILASIVTVALDSSQARARDARRISDLRQIATAMRLWHAKFGNWMYLNSGCGSIGNGNGWFNLGNVAGYQTAIAQCLVDQGIINHVFIDPTGAITSTPAAGHAYMKCSDTTSAYIYAKLETLPQSNSAVDGTLCASYDGLYGMNYYVKVD